MRGVIESFGGSSGGPPPPSLWTLTGNYLYPSTISNIVLTGITSTDLSLSNGSIVSSATIACVSAAANASVFGFGVDATAGFFNSTHTGTGTTRPIAWRIDGVEKQRLTTGGVLINGFTSTDYFGSNAIVCQTLGVISAATNASVFIVTAIGGSNGGITFTSQVSGTGIMQPFVWNVAPTAPPSEKMRLAQSGTLLVGLLSTDLSGAGAGYILASNVIAVVSATTNANVAGLSITGGTCNLVSTISGAGTYAPLAFYTSGAEQMRLDVAATGNLYLGLTSTPLLTGHMFVTAGNGFGIVSTAGTTNASVFQMHMGGGANQFVSSQGGTGTLLPMQWIMSATVSMTLSTGGNLSVIGTITGTQLISTIATGTAPLVVTSTTVVPNLTINATNSNTTDGQTCQYKWDHLTSGGPGSGPWTQTGNTLYPTTITNQVLVGLTSTDVTVTNGAIAANGPIFCATGTTNASFGSMSVQPGSGFFFNTGHSGTGTTGPYIWSIDGTERMRFMTGGTLLVGITTSDFFSNSSGQFAASVAIGLISAAANAAVFQMSLISNSALITFQSSHSGTGTTRPMAWFSDGTEQMRLLVNGDLLLGVSSTDVGFGGASLFVEGAIAQINTPTNTSVLSLFCTGVIARMDSTHSGTGTSLPIGFTIDSGEKMRILASDQVLIARVASGGIGATLQLSGNFEANALNNAFGFNGTTANVTSTAILAYQGIQIHSTGSSTASFLGFQCDTSANLSQITSGALGGGTLLPITFNVGGAERMRIRTGGLLLVGLTGTDYFNNTTPGSIIGVGGGGVGLATAATNASVFYLSVNGGLSQFVSDHSGTGTTMPFVWAFGGSQMMRVTTAGSLLIGLTSNDRSDGIGNVWCSSVMGVLTATLNASTLFLYIAGGVANLITDRSGTGTYLPLAFSTSAAERMRITTGGLVYINSTAGDGSDTLLQVNQGSHGGGIVIDAAAGGSPIINLSNGSNALSINGAFAGSVTQGGVVHSLVDDTSTFTTSSGTKVVRRGMICAS